VPTARRQGAAARCVRSAMRNRDRVPIWKIGTDLTAIR